MLARKERAGAAESGLDLVGNQHDAVLVGNASQLVQKGRRRRYEAAFTEDGLDDECRNAVRRYDRVKELAERRDRLTRADTVMFVRKRRMIDLAAERSKMLFVGRGLSGHRERQQRAAMVPVGECDDGGAASVLPGDLNGVFGCLRAG